MKKYLTMMAVVILSVAFVAGMATAATEAQKRAAIDGGLAWLATQQNADGSIGTGGVDYRQSQTGAALLAFLEEKANWGANTAVYQDVVDKGFNYLFSNVSVVPISAQPAGNPDSDGNGIGVKLYPGAANSRDTYVTGIALPAIASSGTPNAVVTVGPLGGGTGGSGPGGAWTYKDVVQNTMDYFAYGQSDPATGVYRGGWRYYANYGNSDQSTTQWPIISAYFASKMGVSLPAWVSTELDYWVNYIQNAATGAAGYTSPTSYYGRMNETGALLIMQDYLGWDPSDARVQAALTYINDNWKIGVSSYEGNLGHPYGMWAIYKGLELMIGLDDETTITNLRPDPGDVDNPDHGWNWFEDYCDYLVNTQNANGSWSGYSSWGTWLATPWYINILAGLKVDNGNGNGNHKVPEPATLLLLGLGLIGVGVMRRKS